MAGEMGLIGGGSIPAAYRGLLRNRNYRVWFLSSLGSSLGDWAGLFALQVLVVSLAEPGSRLALFGLGGIMMARLLPSVIFGPVAGVLADRYDRKRLMVTTDLARGALFVGIAFSRDLTALFTLTFLVECLSLLYISAKDASLPTIVDRRHLTEANQLNLLVTYGPLPFGAAAATLMTAVAAWLVRAGVTSLEPVMLALLVNALTFFVAGIIITRLQLGQRARRPRHDAGGEEAPGVLDEVREGLRFIQQLPLIRSLILGVVGVCFGAGVVVTLGPEFVRASLGRPNTDWLTLITFVGGGLLAGILLAPVVTRKIAKARLFPIVLTATGAAATIIAVLPAFEQVLPLAAVLGITAGLSFVTGYTLLHENTEDEVRARTFAAFYTGTRISMFAALALAPFLAGVIGRFSIGAGGRLITMSGVRITMLAGGLVALVSAVSAGRGMYRALRDRPEEDGGRGVRLRVPPEEAQHPGVFVAFEGVEGSGKTTQVRALAERLRAEGYDVVVTREPGGAPVAERIRGVLLEPDEVPMHPRTEALLYAAARVEHVERVILPALQEGKVVLCDRFLDSSLAYQGFGRGLGDSDVAAINHWGVAGVLPDVVVVLRLDPEVGLRRAAERARLQAAARRPTPGGPGGDRMEREDITFHQTVGEAFLDLARRDRKRYVVVDAADDPGAVARHIREALARWLPEDGRGPSRPRRSSVA